MYNNLKSFILTWIKESVHQIVSVVFRYFERFRLDRLVERIEEFSGKIAAVVDAAIHRNELVDGRLVLWKRKWINRLNLKEIFGST